MEMNVVDNTLYTNYPYPQAFDTAFCRCVT